MQGVVCLLADADGDLDLFMTFDGQKVSKNQLWRNLAETGLARFVMASDYSVTNAVGGYTPVWADLDKSVTERALTSNTCDPLLKACVYYPCTRHNACVQ